MTPEFPLISIYKNLGLDIFKNDSLLRKVTTFTFLEQNPSETILYDRNGKSWTFTWVNDKVKNNFKTRLLTKTIYNPAIAVEIRWQEIGRYELNQLKNDIFVCIAEDDDFLTQFEEGTYISSEIKKCNTFSEIIGVLNKYRFEVDYQELIKEQAAREKK